MIEYNMYQVNEKDWKLFRKLLPGWQEAYMERLVEEYKALLNSDEKASKKFWALDKRIHGDRRHTRVVAEMRRSKMVDNLVRLYAEGAITEDDLNAFTEELQDQVKTVYDIFYN